MEALKELELLLLPYFFNPISFSPAGQEKGASHPGSGAQHTSGREQNTEVRKPPSGIGLGLGQSWAGSSLGAVAHRTLPAWPSLQQRPTCPPPGPS